MANTRSHRGALIGAEKAQANSCLPDSFTNCSASINAPGNELPDM